MHITAICSGNICRSPMTEYLLRREFQRNHISGITVSSAGTLHLSERTMEPTCLELLEADGIDASGFRSTVCDAQVMRHSDLTLCFTMNHIDEVVQYSPAAVRSTFLLTDFAVLCQLAAMQGVIEGDMASQRLESIIDAAPLLRPLLPPSQEIADPYGKPREAFNLAHLAIAKAAATIAMIVAAPAATPTEQAQRSKRHTTQHLTEPAPTQHVDAQPYATAQSHAAADNTSTTAAGTASSATAAPATAPAPAAASPVAASTTAATTIAAETAATGAIADMPGMPDPFPGRRVRHANPDIPSLDLS